MRSGVNHIDRNMVNMNVDGFKGSESAKNWLIDYVIDNMCLKAVDNEVKGNCAE